jgi:hypothetical protein
VQFMWPKRPFPHLGRSGHSHFIFIVSNHYMIMIMKAFGRFGRLVSEASDQV